jgi:hypothetical protein
MFMKTKDRPFGVRQGSCRRGILALRRELALPHSKIGKERLAGVPPPQVKRGWGGGTSKIVGTNSKICWKQKSLSKIESKNELKTNSFLTQK